MTTIEWTDKTWNPVTGCTKVSLGCDLCYMHRQYPRLKAMRNLGYSADAGTVTMVESRIGEPLNWTKPSRIFVCSMSDLWHKSVPFGYIDKIFHVMSEASESRGHMFQTLTKRPGRMLAWWNTRGSRRGAPNVWPKRVLAGTSVESQEFVYRLDALSQVPADVRFVSAEPLLGHLDLRPWLSQSLLHWVIAGGESGPGARPMDEEWARSLQRQCADFLTPFFLKQLGGYPRKRAGADAVLDGKRYIEQPLVLSSRFSGLG